MKILKQVAGIDVAKDELVVCVGFLTGDLQLKVKKVRKFANSQEGCNQLMVWCNKIATAEVPLHFVMEATGVYHERLAYYLVDQQCRVSIVLPNKISSFFRTLEVKTITDNTSAETITTFGLGRNLDLWKKPDPSMRTLRQLSREREQVVIERTMVLNQLHAEESEAFPNKTSLNRIKKRIQLLDKQEDEIKKEIQQLVKSNADLKKSVELITTIPGVGELTAAIVLGETAGFELMRNRRQVTSYAGLDVREKQSGTSVRGKPTISKRGNRYLRKALYLPALAAKRNGQFKTVFDRLVTNGKTKMQGVVAIQRRLLELIFTLHKTQKPYNPNYLSNAIQKEKQPA